MSSTQFVEMYHPLIPSTATDPVEVALQSVDDHAARGWLLVDPEVPPPAPSTPYYTTAAADSRFAKVDDIDDPETLTGERLRAASVAVVGTRTGRSFARRRAPLAQMISSVQAGHAWAASGTGLGTAELNDTTDFALGTQSIRVTTAGNGQNCDLDLSGLTLNMTDRYVRIWLKVDDLAKLDSITLYFGDTALTNNYSGQVLYPPSWSVGQSYVRNGEWAALDVPRGDLFSAAGSPSWATMQRIKVRVKDRGAGAVTVRLGGIAAVSEPTTAYPNGVVSLTFDDSFTSAYTVARPRMDLYGFPGTLFPICEHVGVVDRISLAQVKALANINGWEVGGHASTLAAHVAGNDTMTAAQLAAEYDAILSWMDANNLRGESFAWPNGNSSSTSETAAAQFWRTARGVNYRTHETYPPSHPYRLRAVNPTSLSLAQMTAKVDLAKASRAWVVFVFHDIVTTKAKANDVATADFDALMDYINTQAVPVRTVGQVTTA